MSTVKGSETGDNLISVIQVFRHGHKTPTYLYPNDPYKDDSYPTQVMREASNVDKQEKQNENIPPKKSNNGQSFWKYGPGKMTEEGMRQCYELGQCTRKRYLEFLPSNCLEEHVCFYTTDYERTRISAKAFLTGFFRPLNKQMWNGDVESQPISPKNANKSILNIFPAGCDAYQMGWNIVLKNSFDEIKKNHEDIVTYLVQHSGLNITELQSFYFLHEILFIENTLGFELPDWTKPVYPKPLDSFAIKQLSSLTATDQLKRLATGPFLNAVVEHFEKILEDPTSCHKFIAYCGHDTNIHNIMNTLGHPSHLPSFGSSIFFELRKSDNGQAYINIYYKNEDFVPITLSGGNFNCDLNDFKSLLSKYIINLDSFFKECSSEVKTD